MCVGHSVHAFQRVPNGGATQQTPGCLTLINRNARHSRLSCIVKRVGHVVMHGLQLSLDKCVVFCASTCMPSTSPVSRCVVATQCPGETLILHSTDKPGTCMRQGSGGRYEGDENHHLLGGQLMQPDVCVEAGREGPSTGQVETGSEAA